MEHEQLDDEERTKKTAIGIGMLSADRLSRSLSPVERWMPRSRSPSTGKTLKMMFHYIGANKRRI
jgi:hypothetical protein